MKFLMITYANENSPEPTPEHLAEIGKLSMEGMQAGWLLDTGGITAGESATKVRYADGEFTVTDGPYAESKELIAGYALVEVASKEEALALSRRFYEVMGGGEGEVRAMYSQADMAQQG